MKKKLFILTGPTSIGKTAVSIKLAKLLDSEIISADSMQIYRYMDIGTAKPTIEEMDGVTHHLINVVNPDEEFSAAVFKKMAIERIDYILNKNRLPMMVGGTGLYINSITHNFDFTEFCSDNNYREYLQSICDINGNEYLHNMLKEIDIESYERLHKNDTRRIIRALEVYKYTGKTISEYQRLSKIRDIDYNICIVALNCDRQKLYNRINYRVDLMIQNGLIDEVSNLLKMGYKSDLTSMQGLGYKEIVAYIRGEYSKQGAVDILKQNTRHYAKRQLTWFRREENIKWFDTDNYLSIDHLTGDIYNYVRDFYIKK